MVRCIGLCFGELEGTLLSYSCQLLNCWGLTSSVMILHLSALLALRGGIVYLANFGVETGPMSSVFVSFSLGSTQPIGTSHSQGGLVLPSSSYDLWVSILILELDVKNLTTDPFSNIRFITNKGGILLSQMYGISQWVQNVDRDKG